MRLRQDAGVSQAELARAAGVDASFLRRIEERRANPSIETYQRLVVPLGAELTGRLYPTTGATIHDRHQARILEALLGELHPRWVPNGEVRVRRPSSGWVDVALHEPREQLLIAGEIESLLKRIEQLLRWSREKADSLPSWDGWSRLSAVSTISQLLIVRWTRANRGVARDFAHQLQLAYPAHPADALAALTGTNSWPGAALIWARDDKGSVRFVPTR